MRRKWWKNLFTNQSSESESGFSLAELLLSMALAILLTDIMIHLSIHLVKQHTGVKEKIALAENAQFAEFILRRAIQTAGFCGCNRLSQLNIHYHLSRPYFPMVPLQIFSRNASILEKNIHPESDVLVIEKMSEKNTDFLGYSRANVIKTKREEPFVAGEPLIIADCTQADVFVPSSIFYRPLSQLITTTKPLTGHYSHAEIGKLNVTGFFIEKTRRKDRQGQAVKALYSYDFVQHRKTEWVSGIESMEFFFAAGGDEDSHATFEPLSNETDLSTVRLIKIVLSLKNENASMDQKERFPKKQEMFISLRELL